MNKDGIAYLVGTSDADLVQVRHDIDNLPDDALTLEGGNDIDRIVVGYDRENRRTTITTGSAHVAGPIARLHFRLPYGGVHLQCTPLWGRPTTESPEFEATYEGSKYVVSGIGICLYLGESQVAELE